MTTQKHSGSTGQSLVEFSLLLIVLVMIFMLVLDLGRAIYMSSAVANAAREAARYGITHPGNASGALQVATKMAIGVDHCNNQTTHPFFKFGGSAVPTGQTYDSDYTYIAVTGCFTPVTPLVGQFTSDELSITSFSKMRNEE
jgi:hypothetical protein